MHGTTFATLALVSALLGGVASAAPRDPSPAVAAKDTPTVMRPFTAKAMGFDQVARCWDWQHDGRVSVISTIEVTWVVPGSKAFKAGMRKGLRILAVNGMEVRGALFDKYVHYFQVTRLKMVTYTVSDPTKRSAKPYDVVLEVSAGHDDR